MLQSTHMTQRNSGALGEDDPRLIDCPECFAPAGEQCDDPRKLAGAPLGMYHCPGCGVMQMAGMGHINCDLCNGTHLIMPNQV